MLTTSLQNGRGRVRRRSPLGILAGLGIGLLMSHLGAQFSALEGQEPEPGIEFVGSGVPGLDTIYLRGIGSDDPEGLLRMEVWANEVSDLYGLSFALQFSDELFKFPKGRETVFVEGPFLAGEAGEETVPVVRQSGDEIIIGHTRIGQVEGVSGSGLLMTLEFRGRGVAGKKLFRFRNAVAFDSSGAVADRYQWLSGKAGVTVAEPPG